MRDAPTGPLVREVRIDAPPEVVFPFFTDREKMLRWKGVEATLDPKPGGTYRVDMNGSDVVRGEFVEIVPFSRIVFTWGWEGDGHPMPPGSTTVEVTFERLEDGTLVRLVHTGLSGEAARDHGLGWDHYLARLVAAGEGRHPEGDEVAEPAG